MKNRKIFLKKVLLTALLGSLFTVGTGAAFTEAAGKVPGPSKAPKETIKASALSNRWDKTLNRADHFGLTHVLNELIGSIG